MCVKSGVLQVQVLSGQRPQTSFGRILHTGERCQAKDSLTIKCHRRENRCYSGRQIRPCKDKNIAYATSTSMIVDRV